MHNVDFRDTLPLKSFDIFYINTKQIKAVYVMQGCISSHMSSPMQSLHEGPAEPSGGTDLESGWCLPHMQLGPESEVALIGW